MPLDKKIATLPDMPYTISYVIRKRQQVDNLLELPKDKRPPDDLIWDGSPEELDGWLDRVFNRKEKQTTELIISDIEE